MSFFIPVKPNNPAALSNSQAIITAMEDIMKKKKINVGKKHFALSGTL